MSLLRLNRLLLAKQYLSSDSDHNRPAVEVAESCVGMNSQNYSDSILSFRTRSEKLTDVSIASSFRPRGLLSRTWTIRGTVHTFPTRDYFTHVFGAPRDRILSLYDSYSKTIKIPDRPHRIKQLYEPLLNEMGSSSVTSKEISDFISGRLEDLGYTGRRKMRRGWTNKATYGPAWEGVAEMSYLGLIAFAGRSGSSSRWMSTEKWLGRNIKRPSVEEAGTSLVRSYIENYGPVTFQDIRYWSGHKVGDLKKFLKHMEKEIVCKNIAHNLYYSLKVVDEDLAEQAPPREVIILPRFDSILMGYMEKDRVLNPELRNQVFISSGIIRPTILLDGFVEAVWSKEIKKSSTRILVNLFRETNRKERGAITEAFSTIEDYFGKNMTVIFKEKG